MLKIYIQVIYSEVLVQAFPPSKVRWDGDGWEEIGSTLPIGGSPSAYSMS